MVEAEAPSEFEWDDVKAASNEAKHAIPFAVAARIFGDANRLVVEASHPEDGETRFKVIGVIQKRVFTVVFTPRGEVCRIISARRSSSKEERAYANRSI